MTDYVQLEDLMDMRDLFQRYDELDGQALNEEELGEFTELLTILTSLVKDLGCNTFDVLRNYADNEPVLIADSYLPEYVKQYAEDVSAIAANPSWPLDHIDWEAAAHAPEFLDDYSEVRLDGVDYYVRTV